MGGVIFKHFVRTLTMANVAYPLVTNAELVLGHKPDTVQVLIYTPAGNAGNVHIGDADVDTNTIPLDADDGIWFGPLPQVSHDWHHIDLTKMYAMGTVAGDTVVIQYQAFVD